jgi:SulP family sulfate permease
VLDLQHELSSVGLTGLPAGVLVYSIDGPFFFGAVEAFERALSQTHTDPRVVILRMDDVPFMDITGLQSLEEAIQQLQGRGVRVVLCGALARVEAKLRKAGILALLGEENVHERFVDALKVCDITVETASG